MGLVEVFHSQNKLGTILIHNNNFQIDDWRDHMSLLEKLRKFGNSHSVNWNLRLRTNMATWVNVNHNPLLQIKMELVR